jgi:outer membrane protein OmpA-like peptidoglycan-associated protein
VVSRAFRPAVLVWALASTACIHLPRTYVVLMPDEEGHVGEVELKGQGERIVAQGRTAAGFDAASRARSLDQRRIDRTFRPVLSALPERPAHFVLYFHSDTTRLTAESARLLPEALAEAQRRPAAEISVVGHTDRSAPEVYNARLALRRAEAIRRQLIALGAPPEVIEVASHGESNPLVPTPDGVRERRNRRVELSIR